MPEIRIWYSAEKGDECFIAQVVEWPGIMAHGDTREEAARQIQLALEGVRPDLPLLFRSAEPEALPLLDTTPIHFNAAGDAILA